MPNFKVVRFEDDDFLSGKVNQIMRTVTDSALQSLQVAAKRGGQFHPVQAEILINAVEPLGNEFYVNEVAFDILQSKGVELAIAREEETPPPQFGYLVSTPYYA